MLAKNGEVAGETRSSKSRGPLQALTNSLTTIVDGVQINMKIIMGRVILTEPATQIRETNHMKGRVHR